MLDSNHVPIWSDTDLAALGVQQHIKYDIERILFNDAR